MTRSPRRVILSVVGGIAIGAFAFAWLAYERDLSRERARVARGSLIAATRCGPIEFASAGRGPAVLLVHGAGGGFDQALDIAGELAAHGYRAITMSRFGYLRTPLPDDASPAAQADAPLEASKSAKIRVLRMGLPLKFRSTPALPKPRLALWVAPVASTRSPAPTMFW